MILARGLKLLKGLRFHITRHVENLNGRPESDDVLRQGMALHTRHDDIREEQVNLVRILVTEFHCLRPASRF